MPRIEHIFLDDGGVVNDNSVRGPQWQRLVGEFFAPRLGGTQEAWAEANGVVFWEAFERSAQRVAAWEATDEPIANEYDVYLVDWLTLMCKAVGVDGPGDDEAMLALAKDATAWILPRVSAAYPGAVDAVRALHEAGCTLHTASSGNSFELEPTFRALGIDGCFRRFYGIDIVNAPKASPRYYERVFAHAGVEPSSALVVDDKAEVLSWAKAAGAMTALVGEGVAGVDADIVVPLLRDLPAVLEAMRS